MSDGENPTGVGVQDPLCPVDISDTSSLSLDIPAPWISPPKWTLPQWISNTPFQENQQGRKWALRAPSHHTQRSARSSHVLSPDADGEVTTNSFADNVPSQLMSLPSPYSASLPAYQGNRVRPPVLSLLSWCQHHAGIYRCDRASLSPDPLPCPRDQPASLQTAAAMQNSPKSFIPEGLMAGGRLESCLQLPAQARERGILKTLLQHFGWSHVVCASSCCDSDGPRERAQLLPKGSSTIITLQEQHQGIPPTRGTGETPGAEMCLWGV